MQFNEIEAFLREREMFDVLKSLLEAVDREEVALAEYKGLRPGGYVEALLEEAKTYFAEDITAAMADVGFINPRGVLAHRERYMVAWAVAQIINEKQLEENGHREERDVSQTLLRLCEANASLGEKTVELLMAIDQEKERIEQFTEVMAGIRAAAGLLPGDGVSLVDHVGVLRERAEKGAGDEQVEQAAWHMAELGARNLVWTAKHVHDGHHVDPDRQLADTGWKSCGRGVCCSMEHMLAQLGFDKDLNRIPRRP